ncbi:DUF4085 family protein [Paenibacillus macerans]|uniref:DUF4085 family protein n=1 Tax=Paenibacillus macerans TaxID=44252 RepID=UPI003D3120EF
MKYFTKEIYEQMQIRGYLVYPESEWELEQDKVWYVENGRDYEAEAEQMYTWVKPYMLKYLPERFYASIHDGSMMTSRWPSPDLAVDIETWKLEWDHEWERRCKEYVAYYEEIKLSLPGHARDLRESVRFHDARIIKLNPTEDNQVELVLDECIKKRITRLTFQNVTSLRSDVDVFQSVCLYEEVYWIEPSQFELCVLLKSPRAELGELTLVAGGLTTREND